MPEEQILVTLIGVLSIICIISIKHPNLKVAMLTTAKIHFSVRVSPSDISNL
jgi:hypothetical protein